MSALPTCETLALDLVGPRLNILFNRPERRNALTHQMMVELTGVLRWTAEQLDVRVVVLRGAGGNFSAGGDLDAMRSYECAHHTHTPLHIYAYTGIPLTEKGNSHTIPENSHKK